MNVLIYIIPSIRGCGRNGTKFLIIAAFKFDIFRILLPPLMSGNDFKSNSEENVAEKVVPAK